MNKIRRRFDINRQMVVTSKKMIDRLTEKRQTELQKQTNRQTDK